MAAASQRMDIRYPYHEEPSLSFVAMKETPRSLSRALDRRVASPGWRRRKRRVGEATTGELDRKKRASVGNQQKENRTSSSPQSSRNWYHRLPILKALLPGRCRHVLGLYWRLALCSSVRDDVE